QSMRNHVGLALRRLRGHIDRLPADAIADARFVLGHEPALLRQFEPLLTRRLASARTRIHGDLHLDQLLHTGKAFVVVDFEGDLQKSPEERRRKRSPLRDVARMIRSFHYAAEVARCDEPRLRDADRDKLAPWSELWHTTAAVVFLRAWLARTQGTVVAPPDAAELVMLLDIFLLSKALKELVDELAGPARFARLPLAALARALRG
ncbi:MAG TPA: hypothetical protein VHB21_28480, partial [Minicystis sp.]|nr:hypothetical protein [Minicystis sp.]